jgi:hypothetical protein
VVFASALAAGILAAPLAGANTVGSPQPEITHFPLHYGGDTSTSGGTVLADGNTVLVSQGSLDGPTLTVCTLQPGGTSCFYKSTLSSPGGDDIDGFAVVTTGGEDVSVLAYDEGDSTGTDFPIISYNSSNDGQTFSDPVVVSGNESMPGVDSATVVGGHVVVSAVDVHGDALDLQQVDPSGHTVATTAADLTGAATGDDQVTDYDGNLLVGATDIDDSPTTTNIYYAAASSNLDAASSYHLEGSFEKRELDSLSGNGILLGLTTSLTTIGKLVFYDGGTSFSAPHTVPDSAAGDDGYATLQQTGDESGRSDTGTFNVFFEGRRDSYDLIEESTTDGTTWTHQVKYGSAVSSNDPIPVLASTGAGVVFESDATDQRVQPIMFPVSDSIAINKTSIHSGSSATITGNVSLGVEGATVTLQKQVANGSWADKQTTNEPTAGAFSFTVSVQGTYRAVVDDVPGYLRYGYSNAVSLTVVS